MTEADDDIDALLGAVASQDRAAFRRVYELTSAKLFGISLRICRDRDIAEEALQIAFLDIWRQADRFDPARGPGMAWVSVVARNRAIDVVRRRGRERNRSVDDGETALQSVPDPRQATDGGAHVAEHFGITPHIIIGDMDSVAQQQLADLIAFLLSL